jgi:hypothetical protein
MSGPTTAQIHPFHWRPATNPEPSVQALWLRLDAAPEPVAQRRLRLMDSRDVPSPCVDLPPPDQNARPRLNSTRG